MPETITLSPATHTPEAICDALRGYADLMIFREKQIVDHGHEYGDDDTIEILLEHAEEILADPEARQLAELFGRYGRVSKMALTAVFDTPMRRATLAHIHSTLLRAMATAPNSLVTLRDTEGVSLTDVIADYPR